MTILVLCLLQTINSAQVSAQSTADKDIAYHKYQDIINRNKNQVIALNKEYGEQLLLATAYYRNSMLMEAYGAFEALIKNHSEIATWYDSLYYALTARTAGQYLISDSIIQKLKVREPNKNIFPGMKSYRNKIAFDSAMRNGLKGMVSISESNTGYSETGLLFTEDYSPCYFTSTQPVGLTKRESSWTSQPYQSVFRGIYNDGSISQIELVSNPDKKVHEQISYSDDKFNWVLLTRSSENPNTEMLGVYVGRVTAGEMDIMSLDLNDKSYSVAHMVLTPDKKHAIFASDMPGGYGGSDLYIAPVQDYGKYGITLGTPKNLGPKINTALRDNYPFIDTSGTLYFSSEGHQGLGGLDVYYVSDSAKYSGTPVNAGIPVNSNFDDFAFTRNGKTACISSNRDSGTNNDDLYFFRFRKELKENTKRK